MSIHYKYIVFIWLNFIFRFCWWHSWKIEVLIRFLWTFTAWTERMWRLKLFFLFYIIVINFQHDLALIANFFIVGFITVNIFEHLVNFSNWIFTLTIIIRVTGIIINYDYLLVAIIAKWSPRLTSFQIWQLNNLFFILIWFIVSVHLFLYIFEFRCIFFAFIELKRSWA